MCSETSEAVGATWEHAQLEFQKFLKIRIPLLQQGGGGDLPGDLQQRRRRDGRMLEGGGRRPRR